MQGIDGINLFAMLSIISIFYCFPMAVALEGTWIDEKRMYTVV